MSAHLAEGQPVTWRHVPRGGYGYVHHVPAIVVTPAATPGRRVRIRAQRADGTWAERWVHGESLEPRNKDDDR